MSNANIEKTLCRLAWDYPVINFGPSPGLRSCCRAAPSFVSHKDLDAHGTSIFTKFEPLVKMKYDLITGVQAKACSSCWATELQGGRSPRISSEAFAPYVASSKVFGDADTEAIRVRLDKNDSTDVARLVHDLDHPRMLEISFSNLCDLKCMYCNEHYSSQWYAEKTRYKEIPIRVVTDDTRSLNARFKEIFWDWFESSAYKKLTCLNFIGGEPLLIDDFYEAMERVLGVYESNPENVPAKGVTFCVVTNFNTPESQFQRWINYIKRILKNSKLHVDMNISLETIGDRTEFIRSGSDWSRVSSNISRFLEAVKDVDSSRVSVGFIPSLNVLSVSGLPEFVQYVIDLTHTHKRNIHIRQNQIVYPTWMQPGLLTRNYSKYIKQAIVLLSHNLVDETKMIPAGRWTAFRRYLLGLKTVIESPESTKDHHARREFKTNVLKLSARRGLDPYKTFPEMISFFNMIETLELP